MATIYEAHCLGGDFQQMVVAFPVYGYHLGETPDVHLSAQLAWCCDCQMIVHAERLLPPEEAGSGAGGSVNRWVRRDAERYAEMLAARQGPPKCLHCGGTNIIPASGQGSERVLPHPGCGHNILFVHSGLARLPNETLLYSPEGDYLTTVQGVLWPGKGYGKE